MDTITAWFHRQDWRTIGRWTFALLVVWPLQYGFLAVTAMLVIPAALYLGRRAARAVVARPGLSAAAGAAAGAAIYTNRDQAARSAASAGQGAGGFLHSLFTPWALDWVRHGPPVPATPVLPPPPPAVCPHGLSVDLCADPVHHYPPDDPGF